MITPQQAQVLLFTYQGNQAYKNKKYHDAITHFDQALILDPKCTPALIGKAKVFRDLKELDQAIKYYEKVLDIEPQFVDALLGVGYVVFGEEENGDEALPYFERALKIAPTSKEAWELKKIALLALFNKARDLYQAQNYDQALEVYEKIIAHAVEEQLDTCKKDALASKRVALIQKARIEKNKNRYYKAEAILENLLEVYPGDSVVLSDLGSIAFLRGNFLTALKYFTQAYEQDSTQLVFILQIKDTLFNLLKQATTIKQQTVILRSLFSVAADLLNIKNYKEAALIYQNIADLILDNAEAKIISFKRDALIEAAIIYKDQGQLEQAMQACKAALELDPNVVSGLTTLGNIYCVQKQYQQALELFNKASDTEQAKADPQMQIPLWLNKVAAYQALGDVSNIIHCCTELLKLDPKRRDILYVKGSTILATAQQSVSNNQQLLEGLTAFTQAVSQEQDEKVKRENEYKLLGTVANLIPPLSKRISIDELERSIEFVCKYAANKPYLTHQLFIIMYNVGFSYAGQNNQQKAAFYFREATKLNPSYADAWQNAFVCYRNCGDHKSVLALLDELITTNSPIKISQATPATVKKAYLAQILQPAASSTAPHAAMYRQASSNNNNQSTEPSTEKTFQKH